VQLGRWNRQHLSVPPPESTLAEEKPPSVSLAFSDPASNETPPRIPHRLFDAVTGHPDALPVLRGSLLVETPDLAVYLLHHCGDTVEQGGLRSATFLVGTDVLASVSPGPPPSGSWPLCLVWAPPRSWKPGTWKNQVLENDGHPVVTGHSVFEGATHGNVLGGPTTSMVVESWDILPLLNQHGVQGVG